VVFERLAHDFEDVAGEFGEFIEEEQAVVGERDFTGTWDGSAADEAGIGDGVMRGAEWTLSDEAGSGVEDAGDGVDLGGFESFIEGERREDGRKPLGEHGFAGAWRPYHEDVVAAGGGDFKGALSGLLAAHIFEIHIEMVELAEKLFR
jgi:hypothetical protein